MLHLSRPGHQPEWALKFPPSHKSMSLVFSRQMRQAKGTEDILNRV